jgi:hypothetical protein
MAVKENNMRRISKNSISDVRKNSSRHELINMFMFISSFPENQTLIAGNQSLIADERTSIDGEESLITGEETFINGEKVFIVDDENFIDGKETFVVDQKTFINGKETSIVDQETSINGEETFINDEKTYIYCARPGFVHRCDRHCGLDPQSSPVMRSGVETRCIASLQVPCSENAGAISGLEARLWPCIRYLTLCNLQAWMLAYTSTKAAPNTIKLRSDTGGHRKYPRRITPCKPQEQLRVQAQLGAWTAPSISNCGAVQPITGLRRKEEALLPRTTLRLHEVIRLRRLSVSTLNLMTLGCAFAEPGTRCRDVARRVSTMHNRTQYNLIS